MAEKGKFGPIFWTLGSAFSALTGHNTINPVASKTFFVQDEFAHPPLSASAGIEKYDV
jgi:hypothetical protein